MKRCAKRDIAVPKFLHFKLNNSKKQTKSQLKNKQFSYCRCQRSNLTNCLQN